MELNNMIPSHLTDEEATAYHEAGHAVVGAVRGRPPIFVTIIPDGRIAGKNEFPEDCRPEFKNHFGDSPEKRAYIETRILTEVAGTAAHDLHIPERAHDWSDAYDEQCASTLIDENAGWADSEPDSYFQQLQETARGLLQTNWPWVEAVARALIERKTISTAEVMELRPSE
jgi:ATP-dependent Zn protease